MAASALQVMFVAHFVQQPPKTLSAAFKISVSSLLELGEVRLTESVLEYPTCTTIRFYDS